MKLAVTIAAAALAAASVAHGAPAMMSQGEDLYQQPELQVLESRAHANGRVPVAPEAIPRPPPPPTEEEIRENVLGLYDRMLATGHVTGFHGNIYTNMGQYHMARLQLQQLPRAQVVAALEHRYGHPLPAEHELKVDRLSRLGTWAMHDRDDLIASARRRAAAAALQSVASSNEASTSAAANTQSRGLPAASSSGVDDHWRSMHASSASNAIIPYRGTPGASSSGTSGLSSNDVERLTEDASSSTSDAEKLAVKLTKLL